MEQKSVSAEETETRPELTLIAEQADDFVFNTLEAEDFTELEFYTSESGDLLITTEESDTHVRLVAEDTGLTFEEATDVDENKLTETEVTEPQPTEDITGDNSRIRRRGD